MKILKNGIRVGNFSSPHEFLFEDGTTLDPVSEGEARSLTLAAEEVVTSRGAWMDITPSYSLTQAVRERLDSWMSTWREGQVDIVLVSLPTLQAIKREGLFPEGHPFRTVHMDRVTKKVSVNKFCA